MTVKEAKDLFFQTLGYINKKDLGGIYDAYRALEIDPDTESNWRLELANLIIDDFENSRAEAVKRKTFSMLEMLILRDRSLYTLFIDCIYNRVMIHHDYDITYLTSILYFNPDLDFTKKTSLFDYIYNKEYIEKLNFIVKEYKDNVNEINSLDKYRYDDLMERYDKNVTIK